jgi:hypothetical protein
MYPLVHNLDIPQFAQLGEEALPCLSHLFPFGIRIHRPNAVRNRTAAAQSYPQVVNRIGFERNGSAVAFLEHSFHPVGKAGFFLRVSCWGEGGSG